MCDYITLIVASDDVAAVGVVMERHGRAATQLDDPSIRKVLRDGERQYLTTRGHCDCGTVLGQQPETPDALEEALAKEAGRLRPKGWPEAKISRAMQDQGKADSRPRGGGPDSIELWTEVLCDLGESLKLPHVGLFVRTYSGAIATESFTASRRDVDPRVDLRDALTAIKPGEVSLISMRRRSDRS